MISFCKAKDTVNNTKRLPSEWKKIFTKSTYPDCDQKVTYTFPHLDGAASSIVSSQWRVQYYFPNGILQSAQANLPGILS